MKTLRFPLLLALGAVSLLSACDDDKETAKPKSRTDLLVGKDWKMTACTVSPGWPVAGNRQATDFYNEVMPSYDRDDIYRFEKPDVCRQDEGPTRSPNNTRQVYNGKWSFSNEDKVLRTELEVLGNSTYDVIELDENTLKTSGSRTEGGVRYTFTFTYSKQ
ncbi:hypothetical protein GCM10027048_10150 [Hymenobacter coalescens]